jgi:hypothetical protein
MYSVLEHQKVRHREQTNPPLSSYWSLELQTRAHEKTKTVASSPECWHTVEGEE